MLQDKAIGKDYIFYDAMLYGTDKTGNRLGFDMRLVNMKSQFSENESMLGSDKIISHEIESRETVYEYQYTPNYLMN